MNLTARQHRAGLFVRIVGRSEGEAWGKDWNAEAQQQWVDDGRRCDRKWTPGTAWWLFPEKPQQPRRREEGPSSNTFFARLQAMQIETPVRVVQVHAHMSETGLVELGTQFPKVHAGDLLKVLYGWNPTRIIFIGCWAATSLQLAFKSDPTLQSSAETIPTFATHSVFTYDRWGFVERWEQLTRCWERPLGSRHKTWNEEELKVWGHVQVNIIYNHNPDLHLLQQYFALPNR